MKSFTTRILAALGALGTALAAMLLFAVGASAATSYPPPSSSGTGGVHVSNPHPHAGGTIVVSGSSCTPGATVTVKLDGSVTLGSGTVNAAGQYHIPVRLPSNISTGSHQISVVVTGGTCAGSGIEGITVVAPGSNGGSGNLAGTGVAVVGIGALGVVLLVGGGLMLMAGRRRNSKHA